ncbi:hypothetical protein [Paraburkholderia lycopersici]|uniref:SMODS and SLOG-associating 2TM effector domain-containing protein n=1 Tax=Paraburkholderia lycopersici TaxID=416944 RepID=A0A1G6PMI1_9BURK|nr:hypothetical protein [Paraburkholderia lycopersici]SDC81279.1 hypothetical protein SAMN05421548_110201 [Paraburkholderia lycopersici]
MRLVDQICKNVWITFRRCFGGEPAIPDRVAASGARYLHVLPAVALPESIDRRIKHALARREVISERYAMRYRSGFLINFGLGVVAVAAAAAALPLVLPEEFAHAYGWACTVLEAVCILCILFVYMLGREHAGAHRTSDAGRGARAHACTKRPFRAWLARHGLALDQAWRRKWVTNRVLTEQLRYAGLLLALPGGPVDVQPLSGAFLDKRFTDPFIDWYRGIAGAVPKTRVSAEGVTHYCAYSLAIIDQQRIYHAINAARCERIHHRLHRIAFRCFLATIAICLAHFFWHSPWLSFFAVMLPTVAAACHGIVSAGEFATLHQQSEEMCEELTVLRDQIAGIGANGEPGAEQLHNAIQAFYRLVTGEAAGWHVALRTKDIHAG